MSWPLQHPACAALCSAIWLMTASALIGADSAPAAPPEVAPGVFRLGQITDPRIGECSGVVRSSTDTNLFWVHNDGPRARLYGIRRTGQLVAEFYVLGANFSDWEDIASDGHGSLYLGDIGNNDALRRQIAVHQIKEPSPADSGRPVSVMRSYRLWFPKKPFDCEGLFIWKEYGYLVSKVFDDAKAGLYRFPLNAEKPVTLEFVTELDITTPVTGADISPQGTRLGLVGHSGAFVLRINGELSTAGKAREDRIRFKDERIEGCCFVEEGLLGVSENRGIYLFRGRGFRPK